MSTTTPSTGRISSPAATGGAGTVFEHHVGAHWLAWLLVRGTPPILTDCTTTEVHFQTEHLGWHNDDFLVIGETRGGVRRKLLGQVKRSFTVSDTDEDCRDAITDCWRDFQRTGEFDPALDRFTLVTLRGTNTLLEYFSGLLDCARASRDTTDFEHRLATPGFVHAKVNDYCNAIRAIVGQAEGRAVTAGEIWPFLRVLHVLSLDLTTATRQTEAVVKTLLAYTAPDANSGVASATWNALVHEAGDAIPQARSYRYETLPEALRLRHSPVSGDDQRALTALRAHSALILGGVHSTLGQDQHLPRSRVVQTVIDRVGAAQVVLVTGPAGGGKSVVAKSALALLGTDHQTFCFRAEEFAHTHLDATLLQAQVPLRASSLAALLASQPRKILLIESVERLLEASTRDAFSDLLTLVRNDPSWQLLLTCRDYSADLVRSSFLELAHVAHAVVPIPPLEDVELDEVTAAHPPIARALGSPALRALLRTPYTLGMALRMPWPDDQPLPASEREFRARFWQEVVRVDHRAADGMPRRREQTFVEIALRRARALTLYANCGDLDAPALDRLRAGSLVATSPQALSLVAPAHDVLEDWAILHWIAGQHALHRGAVDALAVSLGTHPAIRRTYRKWIGELIESDPPAADELFQAALEDDALAAQFRDDTLVALLRSASATAFLTRHRDLLFHHERRLLNRIIHLLRVGCVKTPEWLGTTTAVASLLSVPDGPAWACVLSLVSANLDAFGERDRLLLLGFIEDWARGVSPRTPYPEGAGAAAAIAHHLLPQSDGYRSEDERKRVLRVIAQIPDAARERFAALLRGRSEDGRRERGSQDLQEIVLGGHEGLAACRDVPELVVTVARRRFVYRPDPDDHSSWRDVEHVFGISDDARFEFFPASAYRGPFRYLLQHNMNIGLEFVISLLNHSAVWYGEQRVTSQYVEPSYEIELTFADGTSQTQWCNDRLWKLYRGTSVGPYLLQSALMALESWLLSVAEQHPGALDRILLRILRESRSAALTAVVASVVTAHPRLAGEATLVILSVPECVLLDRDRMVHEVSSPSGLANMMPQLDNRHRLHNDERRQADALPHRRLDFETAVATLQWGPLAPRVQEMLDRHRSELPPEEEGNHACQVWQLALHRMDVRRYRVVREEPVPAPAEAGETPGAVRQVRVEMEIDIPELPVQEMVRQGAAEQAVTNARLEFLMWGLKVFRREDPRQFDPGQWRERLSAARVASTAPSPEARPLGEGGTGFVAAVCVRDHWTEMTAEERQWCAVVICAEIERESNNWNYMARCQVGGMSADRPAAWVISALVSRPLEGTLRDRVQTAFVLALTHATDEVRNFAAAGVGANLWTTDRDRAIRSVNALAAEAALLEEAFAAQLRGLSRPRRQPEEMAPEIAATIRRRFAEPGGIPADAYRTVDTAGWFGSDALLRMLAIAGNAPTEEVAIALFQRLATTLVAWWDADEESRHERHRRERPTKSEPHLLTQYVQFLLRAEPATAAAILAPILGAIDRHDREVTWVIRGLIEAEDQQRVPARFWPLWRLFADAVRNAEWLPCIDEEHADGEELLSALFFGVRWRDGTRHWSSLEGHSEQVHMLFETLPVSWRIFENYVQFLYHIGEQSLPIAFIRLARRLDASDPVRLLSGRNTVYMLEILLQRHVYARPLELKQRTDLRRAVLRLLDLLVECGSSAAFRMRDDFVTPASAG